jgi:prepilin-type N-terminal cleavage/methylation domain-containing protein
MKNSEVAGFTLLEILVALALLGIALLVIVQLFSADLRGIAVSDDYVVAVARAESRMRELLDDDKLSEKDWSEFTDDGYRTDLSVKESLKDRTQNLQVRLLDIGLTVSWRRGGRDRSVTLRTQKVMNKEVGLNAP